jgi:hypothetical protein
MCAGVWLRFCRILDTKPLVFASFGYWLIVDFYVAYFVAPWDLGFFLMSFFIWVFEVWVDS